MQKFCDWYSKLNAEELIAFYTLVLAVIMAAAAGIVWLSERLKPKECRDARKNLRKRSRLQAGNLEKESVFFHDFQYRQKYFFKHLPLFRAGKQSGKTVNVKRLGKSYLTMGDAGCGKSAVLKADFQRAVSGNRFLRRQCLLYFNSAELIKLLKNSELQKELLSDLKSANFKKITFYLDGIDEIGENNIEELWEMMNHISREISILLLKITCRTEFAAKHVIGEKCSGYCDCIYAISNWDAAHLRKFAVSLLWHVWIKDTHGNISKVKRYIKKDLQWQKFIDSPLLMKFLLYIKLFGNVSQICLENKYSFYTQFLTTLVSVHANQNWKTPSGDVAKKLDEMAKNTFDAFCIGKKDMTEAGLFAAIMKPVYTNMASDGYIFTHETFYEYFVARFYYEHIRASEMEPEVFEALGQGYSNDYADFITSALVNTEEADRNRLAKKFMSIYALTFAPGIRAEYERSYGMVPVAGNVQNLLNNLTDAGFLVMKYEIIFRLGRLNFSEDYIRNFLRFVYFKDENIRMQEDAAYLTAVLKRGCAISSSFIGGEEIELDYIGHMLPFKSGYDLNYDLANRSHTLLFYGDVPDNDIFTFRDENPLVKWEHARAKRIKRLAFKLPSAVSGMNQKQKRIFYFRLFDLATILTFLHNRKDTKLTAEEKEILRNVIVGFSGASEERNALMRELKEKIVADFVDA